MTSPSSVQDEDEPAVQSLAQSPANNDYKLVETENEFKSPNKYPDCAVCDQIWWLLTTEGNRSRLFIDLGSKEQALATECSRHRPLVEDDITVFIEARRQVTDDHQLAIASHGRGKLSTRYFKDCSGGENPIFVLRYLLARKPEVRNHPGIARRLDSNWTDLDHATGWLSRCQSEHAQCAKPLASWQASIRPCWLIDIQNSCLVPGTNSAEYIALSYRWDDSNGLEYRKETLEQLKRHKGLEEPSITSQLSTIVRHTIELTRALGQRYLWIDNLCIPQNADSTKELQKMGAIYANAVLTIVAFDENGPNGLVGLKGISNHRGRPTWDVQEINFGDEVFVREERLLKGMAHNFREIEYHNRGWTFQEFELSRRRLIIWRGYLYWICQECAWQDHCHDDVMMTGCLRPHVARIMRGFPSLADLASIIAEYAKRKLSYEEDALPGISGMLSTLSHTFEGGFLCGIPVEVFEAGLCWQTVHAFPAEPARRRTSSNRPLERKLQPSHLPSWSWIGWRGIILAGFTEAGVVRSLNSGGSPVVYETFPTTSWYSMDAKNTGEAQRIESKRLSNRADYKNPNLPLPPGWTRHEVHSTPSPFPPGYAEGFFGRLYPAGCETYVYRHVNMSADDYPWYWPFPVNDIAEKSVPPVMPEQLPNISCVTTRAFLSGFQVRTKWKVKYWPSNSDFYDDVHIYDQSSRLIGFLLPDTNEAQNSFPPFKAGESDGTTVELVVICRRTCYWRDYWQGEGLGNIQSTEVYAVLWIEWDNAIAYRLGYGEVDKDAWDSLPLENINLVLG